MNGETKSCGSCRMSMQGNDGLLRCRFYGYPCSHASAQDCTRYEYEPGTDAAEQPWFRGGWCVTSSTEGRGD